MSPLELLVLAWIQTVHEVDRAFQIPESGLDVAALVEHTFDYLEAREEVDAAFISAAVPLLEEARR